MLSALYLTQFVKEAHVCRCLTCQSNVEEVMKKKTINQIKKVKKAEVEQEVINFMIERFIKQHEAIVKVETMKRAEQKINIEVERAFEATRRIIVKKQIKASMIVSIRQEKRKIDWAAIYRKQWANMKISIIISIFFMSEELKVSDVPTAPMILWRRRMWAKLCGHSSFQKGEELLDGGRNGANRS